MSEGCGISMLPDLLFDRILSAMNEIMRQDGPLLIIFFTYGAWALIGNGWVNLDLFVGDPGWHGGRERDFLNFASEEWHRF